MPAAGDERTFLFPLTLVAPGGFPLRAIPVVLLLVLAGCVSPAGEVAEPAAVDFLDPIIEQHDHADPAQHALATDSMEQLGFHSLGESPNETRGTYGEVDIQGDFAYVAVLGDGGETPGFVIVDITARASPKLVSFTPSLETRIADVKATPDNRFVFIGGEKGTQPSAPGLLGAAGRGNGMDYAQRNGIRVFDVSDPAAPKQVAFGMSDSGCHMLFYKEYAGGEWIFCIGVGINVYRFDRSGPSVDLAARYAPAATDTLGLAMAEPTNAVSAITFDGTPHDMTIQDDAMSGKTLMYASYWDLGLRIVDVSDPTKPAEVGAWMGEDAQRWAGNIHTAMAYETPDGRRLVYAIPELFTGTDVPAVFILDATDLAAPKLVGEWAAPGEHANDGIRFSMHNFQIVGETLYLAYYHAGVWVFDLAGEHAVAPELLGYYLPHEAVKTWLPPEKVNVPDTWDVVLKDGYVYATDINTGLYVLHHKPDALGDAALTSFA